jgi:hypothetical protein
MQAAQRAKGKNRRADFMGMVFIIAPRIRKAHTRFQSPERAHNQTMRAAAMRNSRRPRS